MLHCFSNVSPERSRMSAGTATGRSGAGTRVTTEDVAQAAAVSRVTVSRVLNNHDNVTDKVRERVLRAAADLGYLKSPPGPLPSQALAAATARPVSVLRDIGFFFTSVVGDEQVSGNPFWSLVLHGVEQEAAAAGMRVTYRSINQWVRQPARLVESARASRLDGVLLVGPVREEAAATLGGTGQPLVLVDNAIPGLAVDAIVSDNFGGGRTAVEHLMRFGHRDIAFIGGPFNVSPGPLDHKTNTVWSIEQRAQGYRAALEEAGIEPDPGLHEGRQADRAARIIGEGEKRAAVGDQPAVHGDAVHRRRHAHLAHAVMDVAAGEI